jgi:hypothetical protein
LSIESNVICDAIAIFIYPLSYQESAYNSPI